MNMKNPSVEELKELLFGFDDNECSHNLWVNHDGDVQVSKIPTAASRVDWRISHKGIAKFYYSYIQGNGYVGDDAANDDVHVKILLSDLEKDWRSGSSGDIDVPGFD